MIHSIRKVGALVMAVAMCFSLAVTASAAQAANTVKVYKDNSTTNLSMANDAFTGEYTKKVVGDNTVITLPLQPITKGLESRPIATGYITDDTTATVNGVVVDAVVDGENPNGTYDKNGAALTLTIPTNQFVAASAPDGTAVKVDITFALRLFWGDNSVGDHTSATNMTPNADLYLY